MDDEHILYADLLVAKELIYDKANFDITNLKLNPESKDYSACSFELNGLKIEYRASKITPTKTGQFVTIWKRNRSGITEPFDISDDIDFIVVASESDHSFGQFIFPKAILAEKGIIRVNGRYGKRGIRVYPPWSRTTSKQAAKSQCWQVEYFLEVRKDGPSDLDVAKKLSELTRRV